MPKCFQNVNKRQERLPEMTEYIKRLRKWMSRSVRKPSENISSDILHTTDILQNVKNEYQKTTKKDE